MEILDFIWRSIPMLLELYADLYLKTDAEKSMIELEAEHNVPITKTYDFIVGKFYLNCTKLISSEMGDGRCEITYNNNRFWCSRIF